jgi:hypothetical protein
MRNDELDAVRHGLSRESVPRPDDDVEMLARRKALAERKLDLEEAEIEARIREAWWRGTALNRSRDRSCRLRRFSLAGDRLSSRAPRQMTSALSAPLCCECRYCRPAWGYLAVPVLWVLPPVWRGFWELARCRHPSSIDEPYRPINLVTGRREKATRLSCSIARLSDRDGGCGPTAQHFTARTYPAWVWPVGVISASVLLTAAYIIALKLIVP